MLEKLAARNGPFYFPQQGWETNSHLSTFAA
jgi:hypothetical protein